MVCSLCSRLYIYVTPCLDNQGETHVRAVLAAHKPSVSTSTMVEGCVFTGWAAERMKIHACNH